MTRVDPDSAYEFDEDSKVGSHTKGQILRLVRLAGFGAHLSPRDDKGKYVVVTSPLQFKIEVKGDHIARMTYNIGIEYSSRGEPSGIGVTTADYWLQVIANRNFEFGKDEIRILLFKTKELKRCIDELSSTPIPEGEKWVGGSDNEDGTMGWIKENIGDPCSETHIWVTKTRWASEYAEFDGSPREFVEFLYRKRR